jgi:glycosyltransferase involved in cell wall biosynthesis
VVVFSKPGYLVDDFAARGVPCRVLTGRGLLGWRLVRQALAAMDEERVDLVHLNSAVPFCKYVGVAAWIRGLPVVWHIREDPRGKRVRRLKKWIRRLADVVCVVSTELEVCFKDCRVVKIFNGVDVEKFRPGVESEELRARFGIPKDAFLFGAVGSIEERKGTLVLIRAVEELLQEGQDLYLLLVGEGMPMAEHAVRDYLSVRPWLAARVVLTGKLRDIEQVMAAIDVLVMPSLWEGFPRSLLEAMASGKPGIATEVGEIPYMLDGGRCGLLVVPGDLRSLVQAMGRCLSQREFLSEMGKRARRRVLEEFALEKHVTRVQDVYGSLLGVP